MNKYLVTALTLISFNSWAQNNPATENRLKEVVIRPYFTTQPLLKTTSAYGTIDSLTLARQHGQSLVPAMNTIAGVRMEERSPGSYRLSIRGSLLRSPFGVRNIKIYLDEFPLTDAGGNTYLNALAAGSVNSLQVLKGPQSSIYGANSGGVVLVTPLTINKTDSTLLNVKLQSGSYGSFQENIQLGRKWNNYELSISHAYQRSDGYREHSGMSRNYIQVMQKLKYAPSANLKALFFYSNLNYDTPGGLTAAQFAENPRLSRLATKFTKSAIEQQAAIYSKMAYGGLSNEWQISTRFKHVASLFATHTNFTNPFITNYEIRKETTLGLRTYLEYEQHKTDLKMKFNVGLESSQTGTDFNNSVNNYGIKGALTAADDLTAASNFGFVNLEFDFLNKWLLELSGSANFFKYKYASIAPVAIAEKTNTFDVQFMPRVALSYLASPIFSINTSISKGYSPPTLSEVRASDNVINTSLKPEYGWNYEAGFKLEALKKTIFIDVTGFYYHMKSAIVRRINEQENEYFINAGGTKQWGLETAVSAWVIPSKNAGLITGLQLRNAYTWSDFKFSNYQSNNINYAGNGLTGVPKNMLVSSADLSVWKNGYLFLQHNYTSTIPLNDANTVFADKYHLLQAKIGLKNLKVAGSRAEVFLGADNLLDKTYSLGNDLNAVGNRYFNAAPGRNFYAGLVFSLK